MPPRLDYQGKTCLDEIAQSTGDPDVKVVLTASAAAAEKEEIGSWSCLRRVSAEAMKRSPWPDLK